MENSLDCIYRVGLQKEKKKKNVKRKECVMTTPFTISKS